MGRKAVRDRPVPPRLPDRQRLREFYGELMEYPNVQGCFIGYRHRAGRKTRQISLVCCVEKKLKPGDLARSARLPRTVSWGVTSQRQDRIPVDVEELLETGFQAGPVVGPGDMLATGGSTAPAGTVGVALLHPQFGRVVTTAGHVVQPNGVGITIFDGVQRPRVSLAINTGAPGKPRRVDGFVAMVNRSEGEDYALIQPDADEPIRNLYRDDLPLAHPYTPDGDDVDAPLFVLTRSGMRGAAVKGINLTVRVKGRRIDGALLTEKVTVGGDSGCCVVDNGSRVWGLLVGFAHFAVRGECSVFTPAQHVVKLEKASFI